LELLNKPPSHLDFDEDNRPSWRKLHNSILKSPQDKVLLQLIELSKRQKSQ